MGEPCSAQAVGDSSRVCDRFVSHLHGSHAGTQLLISANEAPARWRPSRALGQLQPGRTRSASFPERMKMRGKRKGKSRRLGTAISPCCATGRGSLGGHLSLLYRSKTNPVLGKALENPIPPGLTPRQPSHQFSPCLLSLHCPREGFAPCLSCTGSVCLSPALAPPRHTWGRRLGVTPTDCVSLHLFWIMS